MSTPSFAPADQRPADAPHRIVIIGGGAGGLELAVRLGDHFKRHRRAEVVLVDFLPTHLWKPLLHEAAAGSLTPAEGDLEFLQQARRHHFRFHLGTMAGLDRRHKQVRLTRLVAEDGTEIAPERSLWYDDLVMAIGSIDNDFGIPGVREYALPLNDRNDAERFHRRLLALLTRAEMTGRAPVRIVIVGGGATGVELAAELTEATQTLVSYGARLKDQAQAVKVCLVETASRLLPALPDVMGDRAKADLERRGIGVRVGSRVGRVLADCVELANAQPLTSDITVWAAGIRCSDLLADLDGLESNRLNQLVVNSRLQTTRDENIFAIGDCAAYVPFEGGAAVPPKAQAAQQEAAFLARALRRRIEGEPMPEFHFHDRGSLITLGSEQAVGGVRERFRGRVLLVEGFLARLSYWVLYRRHLTLLLGFMQMVWSTLGSWFSSRAQPRVKLH